MISSNLYYGPISLLRHCLLGISSLTMEKGLSKEIKTKMQDHWPAFSKCLV